MSIQSVLQEMQEHIGKEIFVSDWTQVTQDQINQFADSTKDHQWIHVDKEKAAAGPFGTTIAHGFLTLSHLPFFSYQVPLKMKGSKMSINYGLDKVRFLNPVVSGAKIRDRITLKSLEEKPGNRLLISQVHTIEIEGQEKPACIAESLGMIFF
ncbi:MAG: MaoC family dehydratase [Smithellaceae bacterium]|jgi:acyl dehydratase|nr:MaoC family dehydratase [Smithellaceae bacterium]HQF83833.1 MaoC family dehydratase [Smithellaceae bacterium]HQG80023.1 MaoC family dehydratase [Smithellaceae bacterium]